MSILVLEMIKRWGHIETFPFPRTDHPHIPILCVKDLYSSTTISRFKSKCYNKNNDYWLSPKEILGIVCIMYVLYYSY